MERKQLKELLTRYYSGETTDSEEQWLRYHFLSESVSEEFAADQELFRSLYNERSSNQETVSFDEILTAAISSAPGFSEAKRIPLYRKQSFRAAAAVCLLVVTAAIILTTLHPFSKSNSRTISYTDPKLAYIEARKTLAYVSARMNKGTEKLQKLETFNTGIEKMNNLSILPTQFKSMKLDQEQEPSAVKRKREDEGASKIGQQRKQCEDNRIQDRAFFQHQREECSDKRRKKKHAFWRGLHLCR